MESSNISQQHTYVLRNQILNIAHAKTTPIKVLQCVSKKSEPFQIQISYNVL
jgi:hypothetical protein